VQAEEDCVQAEGGYGPDEGDCGGETEGQVQQMEQGCY